jgi:L-arabinose isomerase
MSKELKKSWMRSKNSLCNSQHKKVAMMKEKINKVIKRKKDRGKNMKNFELLICLTSFNYYM